MKPEHKEFLDELRESGVTNMWGAAPYLQQAFPGLLRSEAQKIVSEWIRTFKEEV